MYLSLSGGQKHLSSSGDRNVFLIPKSEVIYQTGLCKDDIERNREKIDNVNFTNKDEKMNTGKSPLFSAVGER